MKTKSTVIVVAVILLIGGGIWFTAKQGTNSGIVSKELIPIQTITHGHGLSVDPNDSQKLYIATHHGLLLLKNEKDLYQVGPKRDDYMGFSPHPTDSQIFFSSGHPSTGGNIGFQRSEDGGFTWKKLSNGLNGPVDFHAMAVSPVDPNVAYGWFQGDLQKTTNGGISWDRHQTNFPVVHLAADTKDVNMLYASSPRGLYKSTDGGVSWKKIIESFVATSAVNPKDQSVLSVSEKFGLARSIDGGTTWKPSSEQFNNETPLFISFYRGDPNLVYLLTQKIAYTRVPTRDKHGHGFPSSA